MIYFEHGIDPPILLPFAGIMMIDQDMFKPTVDTIDEIGILINKGNITNQNRE
jgi:hypothetical protein